MRWSAIVLIVTSLLVLRGTRVDAADREHQQIMAEIRMLQEQSQQLQLTLSALSDVLKAVNTKIDGQAETTRRSFADQKLLVDNLANDVSVVREKVDDTGVRLNSLGQELDALRYSVAASAAAPRTEGPSPIPVTPPEGETASPETAGPETASPETVGPETASPETASPETASPETASPETASPETASPETVSPEGPGAPGTTPIPVTTAETPEAESTEAPSSESTGEVAAAPTAEEATAPPVPPGASPSRMFDSAFADYASGQWALAITGFDSFLRTFPQSDLADNAQFLIGEAYSMDQKLTDAVSSYDKVITDHPDGDKVPDSLYKKGLALSLLDEEDRAREAFETVIKQHPKSEAATLAKQVLDGMNRRARQ